MQILSPLGSQRKSGKQIEIFRNGRLQLEIPDPTISSIIATKDRKAVVLRAIQSILNQTYPSTEIIIVDDGSSDGTYNYLKEKYANLNHIRIYRNIKSKGPAEARNKGILQSKGDYITFLDDDDTWHPEKLAKQVEYAKKGYDFITCTKADYFLDNYKTQYGKTREFIDLEELLRRNIIISVTPMVKNTVMKKNLFNPKMKCGEDYDLWVRLLINGVKTVNINEPLITLYKTGRASLNQSRKNKVYGRMQFFNHYKGLMPFRGKICFLLKTVFKLIVPDPRYIIKKIEHRLIGLMAKYEVRNT